jgi:putative addiction module CopG family antidote
MDIHLTPDQEVFVRQAIESGRLQTVEDAVREALSLWEDRERSRAEILASIDGAEASIAQGRGRRMTQSAVREIAKATKARGRAQLASEKRPLR